MICCNSPGHLRTSKNKLQFFYHKIKPESCSWAPASVEHEEMKNAIYTICKSEGWEADVEYPSPDNSPENKWIADVFAIKNNRKVVFEVQFSQISQSVLNERELKYTKSGVESYWLLKDFFGSSDEKGFFIYEKIRSIGIEESNNTLFTSENSLIQLSDWVKTCLSGEYLEYLNKSAEDFKQKSKELEKVASLFAKINYISIDLRSIKETLSFDKYHYFQYFSPQDTFQAWELFKDLQSQYGLLLDKKNQFYSSEKLPDGSPSQKNGKFIGGSDDQITEITKLLKKYSETESICTSLLKKMETYALEKLQKNRENYSKKISEKPKRDSISYGQKAIFQFSQDLPLENYWLIASSGNKYQNPVGCKWPLVEADAIEFERKGYGKIVEELVYVPED